MAHIDAVVSYIKLDAVVEPVVPALSNIVAHVFPRIRVFVDHDELHAMVGESPLVITYSVWDAGQSTWDQNIDGAPRTRWDIQLR